MTKLTAFLLWLALTEVWAQVPVPAPPAAPAPVPQSEPAPPQPEAPKVEGSASPAGAVPGTSKDRLFFALPNFLTLENAGKVPPLTVKEKFKVTLRSSFDPVEYFWYGALAGISQGENSEPGFGQGAEGYAKRYGAYFADGTMENVITEAVPVPPARGPALLPDGQRRIRAAGRLRREPHLHHPHGQRPQRIQLL